MKQKKIVSAIKYLTTLETTDNVVNLSSLCELLNPKNIDF